MTDPDEDDTLEEALRRAEQFPEAIQGAANEQNILPSEYSAFQDGVLTVYRGETVSGYEELIHGDRLQRPGNAEAPIYFTDSIQDAERYARGKFNEGKPVLMKAEAPAEFLDTSPVKEVELERGNTSFMEKDVLYNAGRDGDNIKWVAISIPERWIEIEYLEE